jgi:hypothetical protein
MPKVIIKMNKQHQKIIKESKKLQMQHQLPNKNNTLQIQQKLESEISLSEETPKGKIKIYIHRKVNKKYCKDKNSSVTI